MVSNNRWNLKNRVTHERHSGLDPEGVANFLAKVPAATFNDWSIASDGTEEWHSCNQITSLRLIPFGLPALPSNLGFTAPQVDWLAAVLHAGKLQFSESAPAQDSAKRQSPEPVEAAPAAASSSPPVTAEPKQAQPMQERRKNSRFKKRLQVVLISATDAFRTFTRNVSLGGMILERGVPQSFLGTESTIFLTDPNSTRKIRVTGRLIASDSTACRISFAELSQEDRNELERWISTGEMEGNPSPRAA